MLKKNNAAGRLIAFVALCLVFVSHAPAQNPAASPLPSAQQITQKVEEYMNAAVKVEGFNGAILVARDGKPVVSRGYGMQRSSEGRQGSRRICRCFLRSAQSNPFDRCENGRKESFDYRGCRARL